MNESKEKKAPLNGSRDVKALLLKWWQPVLDRLLFLLGPLVSLFIVEMLNEKNPFKNLNFKEWWMNMVLYVVVWVFLWLLFGRRRRAATVGVLFFFLAGLANHYILNFKGTVLFPNDIAGWKTAANVAATYDFSPDVYIFWALDILAAYLFLYYLAVPRQKERAYFRPLWLNLIPAAAAVAYVYMFFFSSWLIDAGIKTQQWSTQSNGWVLNFSIALRYSRVEKPSAYSPDALEKAVAELDGTPSMTLMDDIYTSTAFDETTNDDGEEKPSSIFTVKNDPSGVQPVNIICIMDESFGDLSIFDTLETNADAIPFYHSLTENTVKGWMYSPVTGGGTANVEYEFLTGNSISFLPPGTVAYQLYIQDKMPSLISWANALGFETTTFHPYHSSGWNRVNVYNSFDADTQLYREDVEDPKFVRKYVSDACDFETLKAITSAEEGDKQFIFNVTMQNHGGYKQGWNNLPNDIVLEGKLAGLSEYAEQYLNLMAETDRALEDLLSYYSTVDEPTMVVMFGDHQGKLSTWLYERLYRKDLDERTVEELEQQYVVPFFIWTNYDMDAAQDVMISTNYLGVLMAQLSNYPTTKYMDFLAGLYEELPVINKVGYATADGQMTEDLSDLPEELRERVEQYQLLSYYNLFGWKKNRLESIDAGCFLP